VNVDKLCSRPHGFCAASRRHQAPIGMTRVFAHRSFATTRSFTTFAWTTSSLASCSSTTHLVPPGAVVERARSPPEVIEPPDSPVARVIDACARSSRRSTRVLKVELERLTVLFVGHQAMKRRGDNRGTQSST